MPDEPNTNQPCQPPKGEWLRGLLWLPIAFVPSGLGLAFDMPRWAFITVNVLCSLIAAFGYWRSFVAGHRAVRGLLGVATGWVFFIVNLNLVALLTLVFMGFNVLLSLLGCCADLPQ